MVFYNDSPTISDLVAFDLTTTDIDGNLIDPYKVNTIIIYFIERGFSTENLYQYTKTVGSETYQEYFKEAVPLIIFGDDETPAWLSTNPDDAFIEKLTTDDDGNTLVGTFRLLWQPRLAREGDYLLCYQWTPVIAGDTISRNISFYLYSDTKQSTSIPTHFTKPDKYETLLDRYQPETYSTLLGGSDLTPDVLDKTNKAIAKGFTIVEDQANQIVDLLDANVLNEALLPYLGNTFGLRLVSQDTTLWRKQIKRAIPLAKKKGTMSGLQEALANADVVLTNITRLWQVVSKSTWQEAFVIDSIDEPITFSLSKSALLPVETNNFEVWIRYSGETSYTQLTTDYVVYTDSTTATWVGDNLSISPISLSIGDVIRLVYKIVQPANQTIENYIRTLPLADQRDETTITLPYKNWNVRVIGEDDPMFDVIITERHPFHYPVVFGKVRTEFAYSENVYNMEEYNGSTRDSTDPCDLDKSFMDSCSDCIGSKFVLTVEIEDISNDRIEDVTDIVTNFMPFHAVVHSINYSGSKNEFVPAPVEEIEILGTITQEDNVTVTQIDFNRLIYDGSSDAATLKRNMLASTSASAYAGTGGNVAITLFSPGIQFDSLALLDSSKTYLEILSGTDQGEYQVSESQKFTVDIIQGSPDTISWPLDESGFPFRLSKLLFSGSADITQINNYKFSDSTVTFVDYGTNDDWEIVITSGLYAGTYQIDTVNPDNTISIIGFPTTATITGLNYELRNASSQLRHSGTAGKVVSASIGVVDIDVNAYDAGIRSGDYVKYGSTQYRVSGTDSDVYIENYTGGTVIGTASVDIYRRLIDGAVGYLSIRGMKLTGTTPTISYVAETNQFLENYLILIGTGYYQIDSIDGSDMYLNGPMLSWGLAPVAVNYSIIQFIKTSPITTETPPPEITYAGAVQFDRLDRRGNESIVVETETSMPMFMTANFLNNDGQISDTVSQKEEIWIDVQYR